MTSVQHEPNKVGDLWARLAASVPASIIQWRQQGKPKARDGKFYAPFVAYIDAQFVRERLDAVVPGEWDLTLELLPPLLANADGEANEEPIGYKARLSVLGVHREDVGTGHDYKTASTDAFKRAAVRFGIGHELYTDYKIVWVQVDSDSKYAKTVEDPSAVWSRKQGRPQSAAVTEGNGNGRDVSVSQISSASSTSSPSPNSADPSDEPVSCPKCGSGMFDNRVSKRNPKAPDFKCRNRSCDGVIWPPKGGTPNAATQPKSDDEAWRDAVASEEVADGLPF